MRTRIPWISRNVCSGPAAGVAALAVALLPLRTQTLPRQFDLPRPLFAPDSAWNQRVSEVAVLPESDQQILLLYRVLRGDTSTLVPVGSPPLNYPFIDINYDDFSFPVFRIGQGERDVLLRDYEGHPGSTSPKLTLNPDGTVAIPAPAGTVRSAGPLSLEADGHLVLFDTQTLRAYEFWQATTRRNNTGSLGGGQTGMSILEAGAIDLFDVTEDGTNPPTYSSARATGTALLAGLIVPEDVERGVIDHALAFAIPGLRNRNSADPTEPFPADYFYPASTTESDFINTDPQALAAGQRVRLKQSLIDEEGYPIDEELLAPITRMFLTALREYGSYLVDNAGGFTFYAEDIHTAVLDLSDGELKQLVGLPPTAAIPEQKTKWQLAMESLNQELERIPLAYGPWQDGQNAATAEITASNFEVIGPFQATHKLYFAQFGNGEGFTSDLLLTNPSASRTVSGTLELFDDTGDPLPVDSTLTTDRLGVPGVSDLRPEVASRMVFSIPPRGVTTISTSGQGAIVVGSARVTADSTLGGVVRFSIPEIGIAGVSASQPMSGFIAPVRRRKGAINTGVAVHNTGSQAVTLDLALLNEQGDQVPNGAATIESFPGSGHLALFINELFPAIDTDAFDGVLTLEARGGMVAAIVLELGPEAGQFTTLTVTQLE